MEFDIAFYIEVVRVKSTNVRRMLFRYFFFFSDRSIAHILIGDISTSKMYII